MLAPILLGNIVRVVPSLLFGYEGKVNMTPHQIAETLWQSIRQGVHDPQALHKQIPTADKAYLVMLDLLDRQREAGDRQAGWKVGLTAKAIQAQIGFHEPIFGYLLESGLHQSDSQFEVDTLICPSFENELCITMGAELKGPDVSCEQARSAIASIAPAFEIIENRHVARPDMWLTLADNGQQKAFVTGAAAPLGARDLAKVSVEILVNGVVQERALGAEVLGDGPIASVAWLANKLSAFGRHLTAGSRIMSGSFTRQYAIKAGESVEARFDSIGSVRATFR